MKKLKKKNVQIPNFNELSEIYSDGSYLKKNNTWHFEDSSWKCAQIVKLLSNNDINPNTFCEVGCGAGGVLSELSLAFENSNLFGFEISPQAYELCKLKESRKVHFELGNIFDTNDCYDVVLCLDVFEHVPDYMGFLSNLKSKGEYKVFHIPLDISVFSVLSGRMTNSRSSMGHLHYFTPSSAIDTLEDCGYEVLDSFFTAGFLRSSRSTKLKSRLALIPRKLLYKLSPRILARIFGGCSLIVLAK
jgi:hypothetical protein